MNIAGLLLQLAPEIVKGLTKRGVPAKKAEEAVDGAVSDAATAHDQAQDLRIQRLEQAVTALARKIGA